jgi:hypothetical protein
MVAEFLRDQHNNLSNKSAAFLSGIPTAFFAILCCHLYFRKIQIIHRQLTNSAQRPDGRGILEEL